MKFVAVKGLDFPDDIAQLFDEPVTFVAKSKDTNTEHVKNKEV